MKHKTRYIGSSQYGPAVHGVRYCSFVGPIVVRTFHFNEWKIFYKGGIILRLTILDDFFIFSSLALCFVPKNMTYFSFELIMKILCPKLEIVCFMRNSNMSQSQVRLPL